MGEGVTGRSQRLSGQDLVANSMRQRAGSGQVPNRGNRTEGGPVGNKSELLGEAKHVPWPQSASRLQPAGPSPTLLSLLRTAVCTPPGQAPPLHELPQSRPIDKSLPVNSKPGSLLLQPFQGSFLLHVPQNAPGSPSSPLPHGGPAPHRPPFRPGSELIPPWVLWQTASWSPPPFPERRQVERASASAQTDTGLALTWL